MSAKSVRRDREVTPSAQARAERMVGKIRTLYELGIRANTDDRPTRDWAEREQLTEHTMRRARKFAREFTAEQLDRLCGLRRPNGLPLQWNHVVYLLTVENPAERLQWAEKAAKLGWTAPVLHGHIKASRGARVGHGRTIQLPRTLEEGLEQLARDADLWIKRSEVVIPQAARSVTSRTRHRPAERRAVESLLAVVERLQRRCRQVANELQERAAE